MSCYESEPVKLSIKSLKMPRRAGQGMPGEVSKVYRGVASCGWESRSVGTELQAWGWGRQHAMKSHTALMVPCSSGRHIKARRTGYCIKCDTDLLTPAARAKKVAKEFDLSGWE